MSIIIITVSLCYNHNKYFNVKNKAAERYAKTLNIRNSEIFKGVKVILNKHIFLGICWQFRLDQTSLHHYILRSRPGFDGWFPCYGFCRIFLKCKLNFEKLRQQFFLGIIRCCRNDGLCPWQQYRSIFK